MDKRTTYDDSEKFAIVRLFLDSGMELKTFAREAGLNPRTVREWFQKYQEGTLLKDPRKRAVTETSG